MCLHTVIKFIMIKMLSVADSGTDRESDLTRRLRRGSLSSQILQLHRHTGPEWHN